MDNKPLAGLTAMITGASQGIGAAIARGLADDGARIAACDVSPDVERLAAELPDAAGFICDVADADSVNATIKSIAERLDGPHILVNNAGIAIDGLLMRTKDADWARVLEVNLTGAYNCAKAAVRHLLKAKERGRIVNIVSVVGERGNVGQMAYAASKAGLVGVTKSLAQELAGRGVTVNAVSPGFIQTKMTDDHVQGENRERLLGAIPLGRIGTPEEVAAAVRFLCSSGAGYITGEVIRVNGGLYM